MCNLEGYRDPTADRAVGRVSREERRAKQMSGVRPEALSEQRTGSRHGHRVPYSSQGGAYAPRPRSVPLVYICSPFAGETDREVVLHMRYARRYSRFALSRQAVPLAPHLLFPQFLREGNATERELGLCCALKLLRRCDELWIFTGEGISSGMRREIRAALERGMPVRAFDNHLREVNPDEYDL